MSQLGSHCRALCRAVAWSDLHRSTSTTLATVLDSKKTAVEAADICKTIEFRREVEKGGINLHITSI